MFSSFITVPDINGEPLFFVVRSVRGGSPQSFEGEHYARLFAVCEDKSCLWTIQADKLALIILQKFLELSGVEKIIGDVVGIQNQLGDEFDIIAYLNIDEYHRVYFSTEIEKNPAAPLFKSEKKISEYVSLKPSDKADFIDSRGFS